MPYSSTFAIWKVWRKPAMKRPNASPPEKSFEGKITNLKKYVLQCLLAAGQDTVKTAKNTFTARKGAINVVIDNDELLPDELVTVQTLVTPTRKPSRKRLNQHRQQRPRLPLTAERYRKNC